MGHYGGHSTNRKQRHQGDLKAASHGRREVFRYEWMSIEVKEAHELCMLMSSWISGPTKDEELKRLVNEVERQ